MTNKTSVILEAKETIKSAALAHVPQDSDVEAVTDQWLHAIATDSEFYCNPELSRPEELKRSIIRELEQNGLYTTRSAFFDDVFGPLQLKPDFDGKFRFIDLFAGIGGVRLGFQQNGGICVFSSEWDKHARQTYRANHGEIPFGDITRIPAVEIPSHDILLAGFPCQPFSHAGLKLGIDDTRGTLFHDIAKILETKKPKFALLENVRGLISHDNGFTLRVILRTLTSIGYSCNIPKSVIETGTTQEIQRLAKKMVLKSIDFGVPQNRQRIYIVLWQDGLIEEFEYPEPTLVETKVDDILEKHPDPKLTISDRLWEGHKRRKVQNKKNGKGFGFGLVNSDSAYTNTISARYYKDGSEILIEQLGENPRKVSPREAARLQGFPDEFICSPSAVQAYKQFGNSVTVAVIDALARKIGEVLHET